MSTASQFFKGQTRETLVSQTTGKADFLEKVEQRKREYAGSGFAEWGKHSKLLDEVSQGLWTYTGSSWENKFALGISSSVKAGNSKTDYPRVVVDGVQHSLEHINSNRAGEHNYINFPEAPDGTKTYDSATGVVTEHASAAEAFAGLAGIEYNSNFAKVGNTAFTTLSGSEMTFSATSAEAFGARLPVVWAGNGNTVYTLEFDYDISQGAFDVIVYGAGAHDGTIISNTSGSGHTSLTFFPNQNSGNFGTDNSIYFYSRSSQLNGTISNIQLRKETEKVITSRKDLVFLETWHEAVSDKDQVYPLGNVQYGATTYEGITLATRNDGYTRFGEWDTTTTGRYNTWSTLTDAQKRIYINDPDNNIYYDSDADELIQVRYRVRVVEGKGDSWNNITPATSDTMQYKNNTADFTRFRGPSVDNRDYYISGDKVFYGNTRLDNAESGEPSLWTEGIGGVIYEGKATSIALVQRMNQGAYHPTYNPMGCNEWWVTNTGSTGGWYDSRLSVQIVSTEQCFASTESFIMGRPAGGQYNKGNIASARTGRSDQYKYYDAIYAGQVEDLRLNANKLDVNELREDAIRKAVAGEMRGKGKVPFTVVVDMGLHASSEYFANNATRIQFNANTIDYTIKSANVADRSILSETPYGGWLLGKGTGLRYAVLEAYRDELGLDRIYTPNVDSRTEFATETVGWWYIQGNYEEFHADLNPADDFPRLSSEFDSLPWVDIIGDPERIADTFPDGVVGQWIPQVPDGTNTFTLNRKRAGSGSLPQIFTDSDGVSWTDAITAYNGVPNTIGDNGAVGRVSLIVYESLSNFTEPSNNNVVVGDVGDVWFQSYFTNVQGNRLHPSLTGNIATNSLYQNALNDSYPITKYHIEFTGEFDLDDSYGHPLHSNLAEGEPNNNSPAVKALSTVTEKDGLLYLQLHGSELTYTSNSFRPWGDDGIVPILDNEGTKTDLNNNTVKTFCHHTQIPLGIKSNN